MIEPRIKCDRCLKTMGGPGDNRVFVDVVIDIRCRRNGKPTAKEIKATFEHLCPECMEGLRVASTGVGT